MKINVLIVDDNSEFLTVAQQWLEDVRAWSVFKNRSRYKKEAEELLNGMAPNSLQINCKICQIKSIAAPDLEIWAVNESGDIEVVPGGARGKSASDCIEEVISIHRSAVVMVDNQVGRKQPRFGVQVLLSLAQRPARAYHLFLFSTEPQVRDITELFASNVMPILDVNDSTLQLAVLRAMYQRPTSVAIGRIGGIKWPNHQPADTVLDIMFKDQRLKYPSGYDGNGKILNACVIDCERVVLGLGAIADPTSIKVKELKLRGLDPKAAKISPRPVFNMVITQETGSEIRSIVKLLPGSEAADEARRYHEYVGSRLQNTLAHGRILGHYVGHDVSGVVMASSLGDIGIATTLLKLTKSNDDAAFEAFESYLSWWSKNYNDLVDDDGDTEHYWGEGLGINRDRLDRSRDAANNVSELSIWANNQFGGILPQVSEVCNYLTNKDLQVVTHRLTYQHGDLHGLNLHVIDRRPFVIDFGRTGVGPRYVDATQLIADLLARGFEFTIDRTSSDFDLFVTERSAVCASVCSEPQKLLPESSVEEPKAWVANKVINAWLRKVHQNFGGAGFIHIEFLDMIIQNGIFMFGRSSFKPSNEMLARYLLLREALRASGHC